MKYDRSGSMGMRSVLRFPSCLTPVSLCERKELLEAELEQLNTIMTKREAEA